MHTTGGRHYSNNSLVAGTRSNRPSQSTSNHSFMLRHQTQSQLDLDKRTDSASVASDLDVQTFRFDRGITNKQKGVESSGKSSNSPSNIMVRNVSELE